MPGGVFENCKAEADRGKDVVCCSICMYTVIRQWNRENIENYKEIYVKGSMETLYKRDQKGLYSSGTPNVVGVDIPAEELECPDIVIVVRHAEHRDPKNNDGKSGRLCLPLLL